MIELIQYDEDLSVKVQLLDIQDYPIHKHKDFQILYVLEGELALTLFYATYRLQPGSIHIIHSDDVHSIKSITEKNLVLVLSFDNNYFQSIFPHFSSTVFITNIEEGAFEKRDALCDDIFTIVSETCEKSPGYISRINNAAVSLINILMHNFRGFVIEPNGRSFIHKTSHDYIQVDRISRVIQYVYEHYPYKISLSEIAENEQVTTYYLSHMFHKLVGISFRDFLSMVRVEMSEASVLSTTKSIAQIAQDMGFSDAKYYIKHFYEHMGCHPKEYRKKYSGKIYGKAPLDKEEYPLSKLKPIISKYTQYPVFKEAYRKSYHIAIDFSATSVSKFKKPDNIISKVTSQELHFWASKKYANYDYSTVYQNIPPNGASIALLERISNSTNNFHLHDICLTDLPPSSNGIYTNNGLKKPLYYLLELLSTLPEQVTDSGTNHLTFKDENNKYFLAFNTSNKAPIIIDVVSRNATANYKISKYSLKAANSCFHYWSQLNYSNKIANEDIKNINDMSKPRIEFDILPKTAQYYTSIELLPHDIILLVFSKYL